MIKRLFAIGIALSLTACETRPDTFMPTAQAAAPKFRSVIIRNVPHVRQKPDFCGEACAEMVLRRHGLSLDQDDVFGLTGVNPALGRGAYTAELVKALRKLGFDVGRVWFEIQKKQAKKALGVQFAALHRDLRAGIPSVVCTRYDERPDTTEHFRLILGYDAAKDEVIYHEPALPKAAYRRMKRSRLLSLWPLKYKRDRWTVIRIRLDGKKLKTPAIARGAFKAADFAQHVRRLRSKLPDGFHVVIQPPFVVIGNEPAATVRARARSTVKWAVDRLKRAYFRRDPKKILDIWLFKDRRTYLYYAKKLFSDRPSTPYGYYSSQNGALVMNIATGGGTLVHEIVHPFVEANFENCPAWFNEGLGSLYEQSASRRGEIVGLTNWRLAGLQNALRAGSVPSFKKMLSTTTNQFYSADPGTNYAQARYLLYYLQEKGKLRRYYHTFYKNRIRDPTGYRSLKKILGERDMTAFFRKWKTYTLKLRYR